MSQTVTPHVVMIVGNDIVTDTRVRKMATSMTRLGARVTVVCYCARPAPAPMHFGDVDVVRVHVPFTLRTTNNAHLQRWKPERSLSPEYKEQYHRRRTYLVMRKQDAEEASGLASLVTVTWYRGLLFITRGMRRTRLKALKYAQVAWGVRNRMREKRRLFLRWQRELPEMDDYLIHFQPVVEALEPDVIHCHDMHMMRVADRVSRNFAKQGRNVPWVYDAHEYVRGLARPPRRVAAYTDLERTYVRRAAAVITVSPELARRLQRHYSLPERPAVVLNITQPPQMVPDDAVSLRALIGLPPQTPLVVYSGGMSKPRGIEAAVAAMEFLPEVHLAFVCVPSVAAAQWFRSQVAQLAWADRIHFVGPTSTERVAHFLSSADLGLHPMLHYGNHEVALPNKLFEYLHAGLPVVVSDCQALREFVSEHGVGEVHTAGNPRSLADAVATVLADPDRYRRRVNDPELLNTYSWTRQEDVLHAVYRRLLPDAGFLPEALPKLPAEPAEERGLIGQPDHDNGVLVGVGPANMAGQAWQWMKALKGADSDIRTEVLAVQRGSFAYPCDISVSAETFSKDPDWQVRFSLYGLGNYTHVLLEAGRPLFGTLNGMDFYGDATMLQGAGKVVGLLFHGSEVRNPRAHAAACPTSPFRNPRERLTATLQTNFDELIGRIEQFQGPKFVSTPDQLDYIPDATWLPVVVPTDGLPPTAQVLAREVPVVVHAPSNKSLKGTEEIERALRPLIDEGIVTYRRIEDVPAAEVMGLLADADIVIDQVLLGIYGVLSCEGMVLGRLVVGRADAGTRQRVPREIPIVDVTPATLAETMRDILANRERYQAVAAQGPDFVREFHDGRRSAEILREFTALRP